MAIQSGQLRHRLQVQRLDAFSTDVYGARVAAPYIWNTAWGKVEGVSGREAQYAQSFSATVSHKITLRYLAGLLTTDKILFGSRVFAINAVTDPEERGRINVVWATEIVKPPTGS